MDFEVSKITHFSLEDICILQELILKYRDEIEKIYEMSLEDLCEVYGLHDGDLGNAGIIYPCSTSAKLPVFGFFRAKGMWPFDSWHEFNKFCIGFFECYQIKIVEGYSLEISLKHFNKILKHPACSVYNDLLGLTAKGHNAIFSKDIGSLTDKTIKSYVAVIFTNTL